MGHNFAPSAFQKPRLGFLTEQTALYTFTWVLARLRPFGREQDFTETNDIGVRVRCVHPPQRGGFTVTRCPAPPEPVFYGF